MADTPDKASGGAKASEAETPQQMEERWLEYWNDEGVYRFDPASSAPVYAIDTPPPTVSGKMHIGHAYSYTQMDFVARFKRMRGFNVFYPFGFDDNGLPTERLTEREVGVKLEDVGRQEFIQKCLEVTRRFEDYMEQAWRRIGTSCDWSIVYRTIDKPVVKISQESFLKLYHDARAYRSERPTIWCPECSTAIAQVEMEDKSLPSTFNDIAFDLVGEPVPGKLVEESTLEAPSEGNLESEVTYNQGREGKIVISTTRPELIPACVAIFVHPDDERTKHLVGRTVRVPLTGHEVPVLTDDKVDKETGTGVVMNCTFGDLNDIEWWQGNNLPLRVIIDEKGHMTDAAGEALAGKNMEEARAAVKEQLRADGRLLDERAIEHNVNVHERCGTPTEFLVTKQWFVNYLDLKDKFLERGETVQWHPAYMHVRYENWVKGLKWDWCISRQRYFGVPFPVWYCANEDCNGVKVARLEELPVDPTVDQPKDATCAECGGTEWTGESDVMDTWATSSLTPQIAILTAAERLGVKDATLDSINTEPALQRLYPMSLRAQAHEIISFWAFNTIVKSEFHHDDVPWENAMISGFVKLGKGKKMSKSKGNIVEPLEVINEHSGDALRYWSATGASLGEDIIWNPKDLTRAQRLVTKLRNIQGFIAKACDGAKPEKPSEDALAIVDKWMLTEYSRLVKNVTDGWETFDYTKALKESENFVWHVLADHYIELVKHRIYGEKDTAALWTLYTVGEGVLKLFAPVLCFSTEDAWQQYYRPHEDGKSIHTAPWPEPVLEDEDAHAAGELVKDIVAAVRAWKSGHKLPLNAELPALEVVATTADRKALELGLQDIRGTTKAAGIEFVEDSEIEMVPVAIEPDLSKIGPTFKQQAGAIKKALEGLDAAKMDSVAGIDLELADGSSVNLPPGYYRVRTQPKLHGQDVERLEVGRVTLLMPEPGQD